MTIEIRLLGKTMEFFTAYVVEYSLSVDNMFVFLMIFSYFNTPPPPSSPRFSPNVFAVVGLRSLYFLLVSIAACFRFLFPSSRKRSSGLKSGISSWMKARRRLMSLFSIWRIRSLLTP